VGDMGDRTFIDVGCGSGLFSLSAYRAEAREIISFDVDRDSVAATASLHERSGSPQNWRVVHGSVLDQSFLSGLGQADVVYSWGVLHHTGDMYRAIEHAASLTKPGGLFAIAIYNRISGRWLDSRRWWQIKRAYNRAAPWQQKAMELIYGGYWLLGRLRSRQNPFKIAREYRQSRGMALWTDIVDWLGGYPYEFARPQEIIDYCEQTCGMKCVRSIPMQERDSGNNQFVFQRRFVDA
jgi:SAM-dependent methyltransferase